MPELQHCCAPWWSKIDQIQEGHGGIEEVGLSNAWYNPYGTRQASASTGRHPPCFPNRLLKTNGSLHTNLLYRTAPGKTSNSVDGIWTEFELALKDRKLIKTANGTFSATLQKEERIAIRRMMSRYWENSLPFALDLIGAVVRQGSFIEKMHATD